MSHTSRRDARSHGPRSRRARIGTGIAALLILFGVGYLVALLLVRSSRALLPGNEFRPPGPLANLPGLSAPDLPTDRITILVMGIDHRPGKSNEYLPQRSGAPEDPGRSDSMAVISVDPSTKTAGLLSIPRDLWLEVPDGHGGWTMDRINEAFHTGEVAKLPGGGGAAAAAAVTHNFGIPIDYYVDVDFNGFMALFDALGGVEIVAPKTITTTVLPRANNGAYEYTFLAGRQHLNGELALAFARFRLDDEGDFGRIARQQLIALAARQRALSLGWIDHPLDVWQRYSATVQSNIPSLRLPGYALLAKGIDSSSVRTRSLGESSAIREAVIPDTGADVLFPVPEAIARIVSDAFNDPTWTSATLAQMQRLYPGSGGPVRTAAGAAGAPASGGSGIPSRQPVLAPVPRQTPAPSIVVPPVPVPTVSSPIPSIVATSPALPEGTPPAGSNRIGQTPPATSSTPVSSGATAIAIGSSTPRSALPAAAATATPGTVPATVRPSTVVTAGPR